MIELNGISNIDLILKMRQLDLITEEQAMNKIKTQVDLLNRYMLSIQTSLESNKAVPMWHELLENPEKFPTNLRGKP